MNVRTVTLAVLALLAAPSSPRSSTGDARSLPTDAVEAELRAILVEENVPGMAVALVERDGTTWAAGFGVADRASGRPVTPDTLFRVGSISKTVVALEFMRLVEAGRLELDDRLRDVAPDVAFENPWEDRDPVRLVHLLEHSTGWDDAHLREYAHDDPTPIDLASGLAYNPASRRCRWPPGTVSSYCNTGPAVAARVVEVVTGRAFEDEVAESVLGPLGMEGASFLLTEEVRARLATGHAQDGVTPVPYWHVLLRPAGALNASARDVAALAELFLDRGMIHGVRLLGPESVARMERCERTAAARAGLGRGHGLGLSASVDGGVLFLGHSGTVNAYVADFAYAPDAGRGYVVLMNAANWQAMRRAQVALRGLVAATARAAEAPLAPRHARATADLPGTYVIATPRAEVTRFLERLVRTIDIEARDDGTLRLRRAFRGSCALVPVAEGLFRCEGEPVATVAFRRDVDGTPVLEGFSRLVRGSYRRVPRGLVSLQWVVGAACLALVASGLVATPWWLRGDVRCLPLVACWALAGSVTLVVLAGDRLPWLFGRPTAWSVSCVALSWLFAGGSLVALLAAPRVVRRSSARLARAHVLAVSLACGIVAAYLAWWGAIGPPPWSP